MIVLNEKTMSCAVIGVPSDQVRSSRMMTLSIIRSLLVCQLTTVSAEAWGIIFQSKPNRPKLVKPLISNSEVELPSIGFVLRSFLS